MKKIYLIILFVVIICAALYFSYNYYSSRKFNDPALNLVAKVNNNLAMCSKIFDKNWKEDCYYSIALQRGDSKLCESISFIYRKNDCYSGIAKETGNYELCNLVSFPYRETCITDAHVAQKDTQYCDTLSGNKLGYCYSDIAIETNDSLLCNKLPESMKLPFGVEEISARSYCREGIGRSNVNEIFDCINSIKKAPEAEKNAVFEVCKYSREYIKEIPMEISFERIIDDISLCDSLPLNNNNGIVARYECEVLVAGNTFNSDVCSDITDQKYKDSCLRVAAYDDEEICSGIQNENYRRGCYYDVAVNKPEINICNKVTASKSDNSKEMCYKNARKTVDCTKKSNAEEKDICFTALALNFHTKSFCLKVSDTRIKNKCILISQRGFGL